MSKDYSEADLAKKFMEYMGDWDIYPEVQVPSGYIDIMAVHKVKKEVMAMEVKKNFNFKLLEQGIRSKKYAHFVYLAIPDCNDLSFRRKLCADYGLGLLLLMKDGRIYESLKPKFNNNIYPVMLSEHQKQSVAGSQHDRVTSFDVTKLNIIDHLKKHGGECEAKSLLENIQHHYASNVSALSSIKKWINKGIITEFTFKDKKFILKNKNK